MGYIVIAPVGDNPKALFVGMKEFATEKVYLLTPPTQRRTAEELKRKLAEFTVPSEIKELHGGLLDEMFRLFGEISRGHDPDRIIVNVATGDKMSTCAALSAAFAHGLRAFGVENDMCILMPIMKLSYYNELSDNKMNILKLLNSKEYISLTDLSRKLKMSISLLSYHINGTLKYKGLKEYRLVEVKEEGKSVLVRLSQLGGLLLKGYS
ncbi:winged helix-turn-helix transcriptional regulator [Candidatus Woesearchaeota archaeon]|nr:winged helix-turn-helix transcriptional regulator [Candidatus Woesearchaeota archaeon]HIH37570.1 winged helix-turn-helix transcriptional regulator [Candidatus Woesearchaeota archaeon]HIH47983.1 winged helix-turn-helix transcriptional regulator [Candidatus Woesearchaeota archaeon]HIJ03689.1 winged helix-turn-helix transcriptional regulator [Candidatus Woesearchaeota archaeon]